MRISTSLTQQLSVNSMLDQQSKIAKSQVQMSSGLRMVSPSDDPPAAVRALVLKASIDSTTQLQSNITMARSRLSQEDSTLENVGNAFQRLNELALQGANDTLSSSDRKGIATEAKQILSQVKDLMNAKTDGGEYVFGGFVSATAPYAYQSYQTGTPPVEVGGSYAYQGDNSQHSTMIGPTFQMTDSDPGNQVFNIDTQAFPTPSVDVVTQKSNLGSIKASVATAAALTNHDYKVDVSAAGTTITDLATSTATSYPAATVGYPIITQDGIQFDLTASVNAVGTGASTDSFQVNLSSRVWPPVVPPNSSRPWITGNPASTSTPPATAPPEANLLNVISNFVDNMNNNTPDQMDIERIQRSLTSIDNIRVTVGARLSALDSQENLNMKFSADEQGYLSTTQDLDYAQAISQFNLQSVALQAAQQAYAKVQKLSLFNYL